MNKDWKIIYPRKVEEVEEHLKSPKSHNSAVLYQQAGLMFTLNPFGGGSNTTGELCLLSEWKLVPSMLNHIMIIVHER